MTEAKIDTYVKNLTNEKWGKMNILGQLNKLQFVDGVSLINYRSREEGKCRRRASRYHGNLLPGSQLFHFSDEAMACFQEPSEGGSGVHNFLV